MLPCRVVWADLMTSRAAVSVNPMSEGMYSLKSSFLAMMSPFRQGVV